MKVLAVFHTSGIIGGGEISFMLSIEGLRSAGVDVLAAVPGEGEVSRHLISRQIPVAEVPQPSLRGLTVRRLFRPSREWLDLVRRYSPSVIHANAVRAALYAQAAGHHLGIPVVWHARIEHADIMDPFLMRRTSAVICTSRAVARRFRASWAAKLHVVPNAVDAERYATASPLSAALRRQWLDGSGGPLIGVVGRLSPEKGPDRVIRAARRILERHPAARFVFAGGSDPESPAFVDDLVSLSEQCGVRASCVFAGHVEDMPAAYRALDLVLVPSRTEGFGRVVIEAGAAGVPVLTAGLASTLELLPESIRESAVADFDVAEGLAQRVTDMLDDGDVRRKVASELHQRVREHYGVQSHVAALTGVYRAVTSRRTTSG